MTLALGPPSLPPSLPHSWEGASSALSLPGRPPDIAHPRKTLAEWVDGWTPAVGTRTHHYPGHHHPSHPSMTVPGEEPTFRMEPAGYLNPGHLAAPSPGRSGSCGFILDTLSTQSSQQPPHKAFLPAWLGSIRSATPLSESLGILIPPKSIPQAGRGLPPPAPPPSQPPGAIFPGQGETGLGGGLGGVV